jgi:PKD repeat protein
MLLNDVLARRFMVEAALSSAASHRVFPLLILSSLLLSGCVNPIGPPEPTANLSVDIDSINAGEPVNFDARGSNSPEGTVITEYAWEFGDGAETTSSQGLTSHVFDEPGTYSVSVIVKNDQGGTDSTSWTIHVNAYPEISLSVPSLTKVGKFVTLDANLSADPDGGLLLWAWSLDWVDSDGDGDATNEVDSTESSITMMMNKSGVMTGSLTITDDMDASSTEYFQLNVTTRVWRVVWDEVRVSYASEGYLYQGETWSFIHEPGEAGRLLAVNATLTLEMDLLPHELPQDNFTLKLSVPASAWNEEQQTSQEDPTKAPKAYLDAQGMNSVPQSDQTYESDNRDELLQRLLDETVGRYGQGNWTWQIRADQADPDLIDELDPDEGNDWDLEIEYVIITPRITEVV